MEPYRDITGVTKNSQMLYVRQLNNIRQFNSNTAFLLFFPQKEFHSSVFVSKKEIREPPMTAGFPPQHCIQCRIESILQAKSDGPPFLVHVWAYVCTAARALLCYLIKPSFFSFL